MHPSAGGPTVVVERLSLLTPSEGWDATVITTSLYCDDDGENLQNSLGQRLDLKVLPMRRPRILKRASGAVGVIEKAVQEADIVHLHTLWHPLNAIARKTCQRSGRKYALMPHGMLDPYSLRQKRWRKQIYLAAVERRNLQEACRVIFTTDYEQKAARQSLPWLAPGEVIPLGADCPPDGNREACAGIFIKLFPKIAARRCLLFFGRIHPKKGIERLLNALPKIIGEHPEALLVIAGGGDPKYVRHIKELVQVGELEHHVLFTGFLESQAKWGALSCAEIFVLPSSQENFAISMAEAMHMGLPVVISNKVNSWQFVLEANAGAAIAEDQIESGLAQLLIEFLSDPGKARCLGKHGQDFARKRLTWPRVARDMASLYGQMLSES